MKNFFIILFGMTFLFLLYSYINQNFDIKMDTVNDAKNELLNNKNTNTNNQKPSLEENISNDDKKEEKINELEIEPVEVKTPKITIKNLDDKNFIEIDDLEALDFSTREVEITWKTLVNIDKIVVNFTNIESSFPEDKYQLQTFKAWNSTFLYRAFAKYETIDYGANKYTIEAYSWEEVSKIELELFVENEEEINSKASFIEANFKESPVVYENLPKNSKFWNPLSIWEWKITYTDIKWLEIESVEKIKLELDWDSITEYLSDNLESWFFWNTLRPIYNDKWISFYVIRLSWSNYFYEKHYYVPSKWFYWVLELESWEWVQSDKLSLKNTEMKEKNDDFVKIEVADELFEEIIKK